MIFLGFLTCLRISHTTHPYLGKISKKNVFFGDIPNFKMLTKPKTKSQINLLLISCLGESGVDNGRGISGGGRNVEKVG